MEIRKTVVEVTILHEGEFPEGLGLDAIAHEMYDGDFLGLTRFKSSEIVDPQDLQEECVKLGNDGSFFDERMEES